MGSAYSPAADPRRMTARQKKIIVKATYQAIQMIRKYDPELWSRIDGRAAEIRREWEADPSGSPFPGNVTEGRD